MLITRYTIFQESLAADYTESQSSWDFLDFVFFKRKSSVAPNLVEAVFFWDKIHTTRTSFYNQKRKSDDSETKIPIGLMRLSNHWSWFRNGIRFAPLCGYEKREIQDVWVIGEWTEPTAPQGWSKGFIKNITEGKNGSVAFLRFESGDAYIPTHIVEQFDFEIGDKVIFKWFEGERSKVVTDLKLSKSCYEPKMVGDNGNFRDEMKKIRRNIRVSGYKLCKQIITLGHLGSKSANLEYKSYSGEEKWKGIRSISISGQSKYSLTLIDNKGKTKQVDLDTENKSVFKLTVENETFEFYFTIEEFFAEIYRYKRKFIDGQTKFDF